MDDSDKMTLVMTAVVSHQE